MIKREATVCRYCGHDFIKARKEAERLEDAKTARKAGMAGCGIIVAIPVIWIAMTLASGPSPEAVARVAREKQSGEYCLPAGHSNAFTAAVKQKIREPDSLEPISTTIEPSVEGEHRIRMTYRARNGFGGVSLGVAEGFVSEDCDVATVISVS